MRYSTFFKFVAIVLCAASLLGMVGSAAGIFFLTELGGKGVQEAYEDQLRSNTVGYAQVAGQAYASEHLGGAPRNLINQHIGNDWENWFFDWTRVGYTIYDSEGNTVWEESIPDDRYTGVQQFDNALTGLYMKVVNTYPYEEQAPQATEPGRTDTQVTVMPVQGATAIGAVYVHYTDGHQEEWPADKTQLGSLKYYGGNDITFVSNIGELPMGDGWYPDSIVMLDMGGNVVYEVMGSTNVLLGSSLDGSTGMIEWYLPATAITTAAPAGTTYTNGDYTAYDAIPLQGATVTSMNVTYANAQGETVGSEGIASPDLIGTIFHAANGNAEFHSTEPMTIDIPQDCIIVDITFADAQQNCIFEASWPDGVGSLTNDENGYLVFRGQMPGTVTGETVTEEPVAETEATEATEAPEETNDMIGFAMEALPLYAAPSILSNELGSLEAWQEVSILRQDSFNGESWGLTAEGWVRMDKVLMEDVSVPPEAAARMVDMGALADTETEEIPAETQAAETVPEGTVEVTEPMVRTVPEPAEKDNTEPAQQETAEETVSVETLPYDAEAVETGVYYDSGLKQEMIAEYVWEPIPEGYTMTVSLAPGALRHELGWTLLRLAEVFDHILLEALGICIAVFALCVVHLSCSAGRTRRNNEVRAGGLNRIPLDLYLAGSGCGIVGLVAAAVYGSEYFARNDQELAIIFCGACAYLASLLLVAFFFAFVAQIKTPGGFWWRNTLCGHCLRLVAGCGRKLDTLGKKCWSDGKPRAGDFFRWLRRTAAALWIFAKQAAAWLWDTGKRLLRWSADVVSKGFHWTTGKLAKFFGLLPITWQFLTTGFTLVFLLYIMMRTYKVGYILLGFGIFFATILYAASAFAILLESAKRMSRGDLDTRVDDRMLIGGFREFAERLNDLAGVAVIAAQKQLKSERMKTELITNVSHDIKTPLTSIINYVDLLQKPHTEAQQEQYLEVLDRQSQRLKKLIDDLMEMSKASTGNMTVDIQKVDAAEAVNQALGEFADKLERAQLMPVFRQPDEQVFMMADGRLVWRVMSNLLGNAVKYALPGTRIYLDLLEMDGRVIISMKNISREELNVHADELMERFVRGDASRNTEGSGLGLNIAQSLMELQKGQLQILVDGDLFKVTMIFPAA